jgi:RNA polymerase subunit RPABC4/transcription elongation factor Spt4
METTCPRCHCIFEDDTSVCPDCGLDLRDAQTSPAILTQPDLKPIKKSVSDILGSPGGSVLVCFVVGAIVLELVSEDLATSGHDTISIIRSIVAAGMGFLMITAGPALVISLIFFAINRKFPKNTFVTILYAIAGILTWYFLASY